jgi:hypothetical protein
MTAPGRGPGRAGALDAPYHHHSHSALLAHVLAPGVSAPVDVLIVPTARPVESLREAMKLARGLRSPLIALCSRSARAAEAAELGQDLGVDVIAVDVAAEHVRMPTFETDALLFGTRFHSLVDLSLKRNLGILLASAKGWRRALFLDDDISHGQPHEVRAAAGLLDKYDAVGLHNVGYPDNSVVCHAYRQAGGEQDTFVGAGAMMIDTVASRSFFPNVYNEDWFFLLGDGRLRRTAKTGKVRQKPYDPFADPDRARAQEFGDSLAEGLYWLLDEERGLSDANDGFWREFITRRRRFIGHVQRRVESVRPPGWERMLASLDAAESESYFVTPSLCVDYVRAWAADLTSWQEYLEDLPRSKHLEKILAGLGILDRTYRARRTPAALDQVDLGYDPPEVDPASDRLPPDRVAAGGKVRAAGRVRAAARPTRR